MNTVNLIGRLTKDIELKKTQAGKSVVKFALAVRRDKEQADFINCIAWDKTADLLELYANKGDQLGVVGTIRTGSYQREDGNTVYTTDVVVREISFLTAKSSSAPVTTPPSTSNYPLQPSLEPNSIYADINSDDLPF